MIRYLIRRFVYTAVILVIASIVVFLALRITPGDASNFVVTPISSPQRFEELRRELGLDRPLIEQYAVFMTRIVTGNFGASDISHRKVIEIMAQHGLVRGKDGLEIYVMCEIPSNVTLAREFAEVFDGFSIGSNDLTQLVLGVDRDSELVAHLFDERNDAVKRTIAQVIHTAHAAGRKIGICGQAPSDYPEFARFLVTEGIDSLSLNPDSLLKTMLAIVELERMLSVKPTAGADTTRPTAPPTLDTATEAGVSRTAR